jgi:RNA polymerase sigma factor (sigma-70 family)
MDTSDWNCLQRFARNRDEEAFAALVLRYGPLVMGVCRRRVRDAQLAEDACQAAFLVLARRAGELKEPESLTNWLFGVAMRTSMHLAARQQQWKRRDVEAAVQRAEATMTRTDSDQDQIQEELGRALDAELARLPEKLRAPLVLCALSGRSYEEAALELRVPVDTVRGRIERAREKLRRALAGLGLALPAVFPLGFKSPLALSHEALSPLQAQQIAHAAAQWSGGAAAAGGSAAAIGAASHLLRSMQVSALLANLAAAVVLVTALIGGAWVFAVPDAAADATRREPAPAIAPATTVSLPEKSPPAQPLSAMQSNVVTGIENRRVQRKEQEPLEMEDGIGNLLQVLEVSIDKLEPKETAQALSKLYNVNIYFSDVALETLDEQKVVLKFKELNGIEVLERLMKDTGTEMRVRDGAVFLCVPNEKEPAVPKPEVPKPADF